jgi:DNA replication protein DnaC
MDSENEVDLNELNASLEARRAALPKYEARRLNLEERANMVVHAPKVRPPYVPEDNRNREWTYLVRARGLRYAECRFNSYSAETQKQTDVIEKLIAFGASIADHTKKGSGIILFGPKGTGKDHLMMSLAREAVIAHLKVFWVNGADMRGDVRDSTRNEELERDYASKLVKQNILWISDPLPVSGALTDAQQDRLFRILDARYSNLRPTWVTVNVSNREELEQRLGPQNADRLRDGSLALFCDWPSHRETLKLAMLRVSSGGS